MLERCWKRHSKPNLNAYLQSFQYPLLSQPGHATGYMDPCLLSLLKQSHQNGLKSLHHNVHEMIQIATNISFAEAPCKNDAIDLPENYKVTKGEISSNIKVEGPDGLVTNHFATTLEKLFVIRPCCVGLVVTE